MRVVLGPPPVRPRRDDVIQHAWGLTLL